MAEQIIRTFFFSYRRSNFLLNALRYATNHLSELTYTLRYHNLNYTSVKALPL